jgi:hypothetical protein
MQTMQVEGIKNQQGQYIGTVEYLLNGLWGWRSNVTGLKGTALNRDAAVVHVHRGI